MAQTIMPDTITNGKSLWLLIISILLMLSGVYVLFNPISALITSAIFLGIIFIVIGTAYLLSFKQLNSYMLLALGILDIMIGVLFLTNIVATATSMPVIFGLWILFNSIAEIVMGVEMRSNGIAHWRYLCGMGIAGLIFSLLVLIMPTIGTVAITLIIGLYLIIYGVMEMRRFIKAY